MKILLCNVSNQYDTSRHDYLGLFSLAASLETEGFWPLVFHGKTEQLFEEIKQHRPLAIGFSCDFDNQDLIIRLAKSIKEEWSIPLIVGGPQSIGLEESFLKESQVDYILRGEGEKSLPELLKAVFMKQGSVAEIPGLVYLREDGLCKTGDPQVIANLDELAFPAYHTSLHPQHQYGNMIFTGRGCPYQCAYCAPGLGKKSVRLRSIDNVMEEIKRNLELNPKLKYLVIMDDTFTLKRERIEKFCEEMKKIRKERDIVWYCECHLGKMKEWVDILPLMIDSGLIRLQIGIESGDQQVIDQYNKHIQINDVLEFASYAKASGLSQIATNFIVGGPREEALKTPNMIKELMDRAPGIIDIITGFLRAYPGTEIFARPEKFSLELHDPEGRICNNDYPFVTPVGLSQDQVLGMRQDLNRLIRVSMQEKIKNHLLADEVVKRQFVAALDYGIQSRWFKEIAANPRAYEYYYVLYLGEGQGFKENLDFSRDYPQRTFEIWRTMTFTGGFAQLDGIALSPLEVEVLLQSAGRRSLQTIKDNLYKQFGKPYRDEIEFHEKLVEMLFQFDKKYWLTHFIV
ncbi:radical SAM protein [Eubacteriaceae bacterium ES2]|nr:radical SAM protein [Eubacteriaceae bacterium ES2]